MPARKPEECDTLLVEAINRGDLEAALALYEPNASFVQDSGEVVTGLGAIREVMQSFLALKPKFIVCDEPVSALDVSVQAQVVNLLQDLQEQLGLTYLFISHGLSVVQHISTRVGIMYLGKLVEIASSEEIFHKPLHPYTRALLSAIPIPEPDHRRGRVPLPGEIPTALNPPSGCNFRTRCPIAEARCAEEIPQLVEVAPEHFVSCIVVAPDPKK